MTRQTPLARRGRLSRAVRTPRLVVPIVGLTTLAAVLRFSFLDRPELLVRRSGDRSAFAQIVMGDARRAAEHGVDPTSLLRRCLGLVEAARNRRNGDACSIRVTWHGNRADRLRGWPCACFVPRRSLFSRA